MGMPFPSSSQKMLFLVLLSVFSLEFLVRADMDQDNSSQWVNVCGGSYLFSEIKENWNDARDRCLLCGSHLLQGLHPAPSPNQSVGWWHSGNDKEREGVYRQADGEPILWMPYWHGTDEPNGGVVENCLGLYMGVSPVSPGASYGAGKWFDAPCSAVKAY